LKNAILKKLTLSAGDAVLIVAALYTAPALRFGSFFDFGSLFGLAGAFSVVSCLFFFYVFDLYNLEERFSRGIFVIRFGASVLAAGIFVAAAFFLFRVPLHSMGIFFLDGVLIFLFCMAWRLAFARVQGRRGRPLRLAVLGAGDAGREFYDMVKGSRDYEVVGFLDDDEEKWGDNVGAVPVLGGSDLLPSLIRERRVDGLILAVTHINPPGVYKRLVEAKFSGVDVYEMPAFFEMAAGKIPVRHVGDLWLTHSTMSGAPRSVYTRRVKRATDIVLSLSGLVVTLPLMVLLGIVVRLDSPGTALFVQRRVGWQERPFDLYKFRTMRHGSENERAYAGSKDDPRITRVGRALRFFRLDELPQLWNVFKGDMSLIGPRALMEEEVREFNPAVPYFSLRHTVRPGITGWAQVNYRHGATKEDALEKLQYDLYYLKNMSFLLDLDILLKTVRVVLFGKGAR